MITILQGNGMKLSLKPVQNPDNHTINIYNQTISDPANTDGEISNDPQDTDDDGQHIER